MNSCAMSKSILPITYISVSIRPCTNALTIFFAIIPIILYIFHHLAKYIFHTHVFHHYSTAPIYFSPHAQVRVPSSMHLIIIPMTYIFTSIIINKSTLTMFHAVFSFTFIGSSMNMLHLDYIINCINSIKYILILFKLALLNFIFFILKSLLLLRLSLLLFLYAYLNILYHYFVKLYNNFLQNKTYRNKFL